MQGSFTVFVACTDSCFPILTTKVYKLGSTSSLYRPVTLYQKALSSFSFYFKNSAINIDAQLLLCSASGLPQLFSNDFEGNYCTAAIHAPDVCCDQGTKFTKLVELFFKTELHPNFENKTCLNGLSYTCFETQQSGLKVNSLHVNVH